MEAYITEQILPAIRYVPFHILASYCKKKNSALVTQAKRKAGGFIKGVCHPTNNYKQITDAGIAWNRADVPFPFEKDGSVRTAYLDWKQRMREYRENGIKIMAVTPYPRDYIEAGIDPRLPQNEARVQEIAVFMITDLKDIIDAVQITNEMGVPRFTLPLRMREAARFIGIQAQAMAPHRGNILVGYNSAGPQSDLHAGMRPWLQYCDYVGLDIYLGCFFSMGNYLFVFDLLLRYLWSMTGLPVILCEFGYISGGAPKTDAEKKAVLQRYGVESEAQARANMDAVLEKMNPTMRAQVKHVASGDYGDFLFGLDFRNHFYSELPRGVVIKKYPHTPEGQADFYRDIIPRLAKLPFLLGTFVYCYKDSERCYVCGQGDCPTETRWGMVDMQDKEKPSYYAIRDAFRKVQ